MSSAKKSSAKKWTFPSVKPDPPLKRIDNALEEMTDRLHLHELALVARFDKEDDTTDRSAFIRTMGDLFDCMNDVHDAVKDMKAATS